MLCGFFGGAGGHLHNVGAVLLDVVSNGDVNSAADMATAPVAGSIPPSCAYTRMLVLCEQLQMADCGMLQYFDSRHGADLHRQSNVVQLAGSHILAPSCYIVHATSHLFF